MTEPAVSLTDVSVTISGTPVLRTVTWRVEGGQRWVVLGPNGSGKTTLLRVAALYLHPSTGIVEVLGGRLGRVDVRRHRQRIGVASAAVADLLHPRVSALDAVVTAQRGALEPWWHEYSDAERARAGALLARFGVASRADHPFGTLSSGERQRVLLARALMTDPGLVLLDEPTAGLDVGGRETLVSDLGELAVDPSTPPMVMVTHHLEEVPVGFTHALVLAAGQVAAAGPIDEVLTSTTLSGAFAVSLEVGHDRGRWWARTT
ncbi:MAG TPA: ATP-binding cassette domain-containing protein [Acidimicrobiales bacterium]|nr:ATP-binding cassette domain-containing protein [Acidimicrobiales bacterium]